MLLEAYQTGLYAQADLRKVDINHTLKRIRDPDYEARLAAERERIMKEARDRMARGE